MTVEHIPIPFLVPHTRGKSLCGRWIDWPANPAPVRRCALDDKEAGLSKGWCRRCLAKLTPPAAPPPDPTTPL